MEEILNKILGSLNSLENGQKELKEEVKDMKEDLSEFKEETRQELTEFKEETRQELTEFKEETRQELTGLKEEVKDMKEDLSEFKEETRQELTGLKNNQNSMKKLLDTMNLNVLKLMSEQRDTKDICSFIVERFGKHEMDKEIHLSNKEITLIP